MAQKRHIIFVNGERQEWDHDPIPRAKRVELPVTTLLQLKERDATIRLHCRGFSCWANSDIRARDIEGPGGATELKHLGLKCPKCRCPFLMFTTL